MVGGALKDHQPRGRVGDEMDAASACASRAPGQEIVDRAVAGWVSDGLLVGGFEIVDVQHLAGPGRLAKPRQQGLFFMQSHILALASANRLRLSALSPPRS
jgi:hypothetical protein